MLVLSAFGLLFLLPNTWSGGGGPLGNRYFLSFYPAFFFLLPAGRSVVPGLIAWGGGALFVSQVLIGPFVAAKSPWMIPEQGPLRILPVELTMVNDLPVRLHAGRSLVAYNTNPRLFLYYLDERAGLPEAPGIWVTGGARADLIVRTGEPLKALTVNLSAPINNTVTVTVDGTSRSVDLRADRPVRLTLPVRGVLAAGGPEFPDFGNQPERSRAPPLQPAVAGRALPRRPAASRASFRRGRMRRGDAARTLLKAARSASATRSPV